jgi:hemerythrin-like domain-containing protein
MKFNLFSNEPHNLMELRDSLDESIQNVQSFISILEDHHDYLEESIDALMDIDAEIPYKQFHLMRFLMLVDMHGHAEEETLYERLEEDQTKTARVEGYRGQNEHDLAYQLSEQLRAMDFENYWSDEVAAKAMVLASLVKNHIEEEEDTMFDVAESYIDEAELARLATEYINKCRDYLDRGSIQPPLNREREISMNR